ncbi:hypothetical protein CVT24_004336 [Panaeolus cyanescens]|uniref:Uncharacterized protein n=1 Tax=Panaeolus cyanescens TaxID=181874 RepID=A0A409VAA8_9AGAR|nr:hypothetical protein CVT24_004336 [Panaeolus cyanescens]
MNNSAAIDHSFKDKLQPDEASNNFLLPDEPTEQQLREAYDNEEIERFLRLFSTFVQEVTVLEHATGDGVPSDAIPPDDSNEPAAFTNEDVHFTSISEAIAKVWVVPNLPPSRPPPPAFTISRLCVTAQRLYLVAHEPYNHFFRSLSNLAKWKSFTKSFLWCSTYWILWWYNALLAGIILGLLAVLLKRKLFLYPSVEELYRHREQIADANQFGRQVSDTLSAPSSGIKDLWHFFRLFETSKKRNLVFGGTQRKSKSKHINRESQDSEFADIPADPIVINDNPDDQEEQDLKKAALLVLSEVADLHERIRNIFIWRRPFVSVRYAIALSILFFIAMMPPQYFIKLPTFVFGALFWHIMPIICSLSSDERSRLPPPLADAPTDAEYAMELISRRVAAGLQVRPRLPPRKHQGQQTTHLYDAATATTDRNIDWKKWGTRISAGKTTIDNLKRLRLGNFWPVQEDHLAQYPLAPGEAGITQRQANVDIHTYPCQHSSSPGLITLSPKTLFFTPLTSQVPTLVINLETVKGIKKQGALKGLQIRWRDESDGQASTKEDKFVWIGSRDDLFARLVGVEGRKWVTI